MWSDCCFVGPQMQSAICILTSLLASLLCTPVKSPSPGLSAKVNCYSITPDVQHGPITRLSSMNAVSTC